MQNIIIDKSYEFVPPYRGRFFSSLLKHFVPRYLERNFGIVDVSCRDEHHLNESLAAGHGVLLTPNHCRPCDPMVVAALARSVGTHLFLMASWHVFMQGRWVRWLARAAGAFSVYREGMDRAAVNAAVEILERAERPLVIFPEGVISRTNDRLNNLMDGTAFIARTAARKRAKSEEGGKVVVHPVAVRYLLAGDASDSIDAVLDEIETRLTWTPQRGLPIVERITRLGHALLSLKEIEFVGAVRTGSVPERLTTLIDAILGPLEAKWVEGRGDGSVVDRVKRLRTAIVPEIIDDSLDEAARRERWKHLADCYLAQQLSNYPPAYVRANPVPERIVETVERFEEDLTDRARIHGPMKVVMQVGPAIEVSARRDRQETTDPLMQAIGEHLERMLAETAPDGQ
ncbi:MAG: 1-acyl-sn-glycerol-3-phosphate acyltransferase [Phycisphaeraceae bacterium]|nr:1-acyl-sn-glycerol-3-phosphate acyltransferase [Phycisphaeraceae bacterium]